MNTRTVLTFRSYVYSVPGLQTVYRLAAREPRRRGGSSGGVGASAITQRPPMSFVRSLLADGLNRCLLRSFSFPFPIASSTESISLGCAVHINRFMKRPPRHRVLHAPCHALISRPRSGNLSPSSQSIPSNPDGDAQETTAT